MRRGRAGEEGERASGGGMRPSWRGDAAAGKQAGSIEQRGRGGAGAIRGPG